MRAWWLTIFEAFRGPGMVGRPVAPTFLSAGNGDFPVASFLGMGARRGRLGGPGTRNWKVPRSRKQECLRYRTPPLASHRAQVNFYIGTLSGLPLSAGEIFRINGAAVLAHSAGEG